MIAIVTCYLYLSYSWMIKELLHCYCFFIRWINSSVDKSLHAPYAIMHRLDKVNCFLLTINRHTNTFVCRFIFRDLTKVKTGRYDQKKSQKIFEVHDE